MMTVATVGRCSSQLRATCGTVLPVSCGDLVEGVDDPVDVLVGDRRPDVGRGFACEAGWSSGSGWPRRILPVSRPQPERAPDRPRPTFWSRAERHQLPLVVAADERVVRLVGHVARPAVALGDGQRLHQVPAREVRAADVADLPGLHQVVERAAASPRPA